MLFSHSWHTHVSSDDKHVIMRKQCWKTKHCCFQILFMTAEINQLNNSWWAFNYFWPNILLFSAKLIFVFLTSNLLEILVKPDNFMTNGCCPTILFLMSKVENFISESTTSIICDSRGSREDTSKGRLTAIDITSDRYPQGNKSLNLLILIYAANRGLFLSIFVSANQICGTQWVLDLLLSPYRTA